MFVEIYYYFMAENESHATLDLISENESAVGQRQQRRVIGLLLSLLLTRHFLALVTQSQLAALALDGGPTPLVPLQPQIRVPRYTMSKQSDAEAEAGGQAREEDAANGFGYESEAPGPALMDRISISNSRVPPGGMPHAGNPAAPYPVV